jgi:hypothetical protein
MEADQTTPAGPQSTCVSFGLGSLEYTKSQGRARVSGAVGDRRVASIIRCELDKQPIPGIPLVKLPG